MIDMEDILSISVNHLDFPKLSSREISILHEGIAGVGFTENQVLIAYNAHRRAIGQELEKMRRIGDIELQNDRTLNAAILKRIDELYQTENDSLDDVISENETNENVEGFEADAVLDLPPYQIPPPIRPLPGCSFGWISSSLGFAVEGIDDGKNPSTTIYRHVGGTFPAQFERWEREQDTEEALDMGKIDHGKSLAGPIMVVPATYETIFTSGSNTQVEDTSNAAPHTARSEGPVNVYPAQYETFFGP